MRCAQELCGNWSGDGEVCPCALFDLSDHERPIERCDSCGCEGFRLTFSHEHGALFCDGCYERENTSGKGSTNGRD